MRAILQKVTGGEPIANPFLSISPFPLTCHSTFLPDASLQSTLKKGKRKVLAGNGRKGGKWRKREAEKIKSKEKENRKKITMKVQEQSRGRNPEKPGPLDPFLLLLIHAEYSA